MRSQIYGAFMLALALSCSSLNVPSDLEEKLGFLSFPLNGFAENLKNPGERIETINQITTLLLREIRPLMTRFGLNPFKAGNSGINVVVAAFKLKDILVHRLPSIHRASDVIVYDDTYNKQMTLDFTLAFTDLEVTTDYSATAFNFPLTKGSINATMTEAKVGMKFVINYNGPSIYMDDFKLTGNKNMRLRFSGNLESWLINKITDPLTFLFGGIVDTIAQGPIKNGINNMLGRINNMFLNETTTNFAF